MEAELANPLDKNRQEAQGPGCLVLLWEAEVSPRWALAAWIRGRNLTMSKRR